MALEKCTTCQPVIQCCTGDNVFSYSLTNGILISNQQTGFVFQCPPGFNCAPGEYPKPVTIPPGTVNFPITFPITGGGIFPPLILPCPGGSITINIPPGSTPEQILALAEQAVALCVQQRARIIGQPARQPIRNIFNNPQTITACEDPNMLSGFVPGPYALDGNDVIIQGGVVSVLCPGSDPATAAACQASADDKAMTMLVNAVDGALESGDLACAPASTINWNDLVWQSPPVLQDDENGGSSTFSNIGNAFSLNSDSPDFVSGSNALLRNRGSFTYTGPEANCSLTFNLISNVQDPAVASGGSVVIASDADGIFVDFIYNGTSSTGVTISNFTVPASVGAVLTVTYSGHTAADSAPCSFDFSATITPAS